MIFHIKYFRSNELDYNFFFKWLYSTLYFFSWLVKFYMNIINPRLTNHNNLPHDELRSPKLVYIYSHDTCEHNKPVNQS